MAHVPPDGTRVSWVGRRYFGDAVLTEWIAEYEPDIVLSGHVHQSPFRKGGSWVDKLGNTWLRPGISYSQVVDQPFSSSHYKIVQVDIPVVF